MKIRELNDHDLNLYILWSEGLLVSTPDLPDVEVTGDPEIDVYELYDTAAQRIGYKDFRYMVRVEAPERVGDISDEDFNILCEEHAVSLIVDDATAWIDEHGMEEDMEGLGEACNDENFYE